MLQAQRVVSEDRRRRKEGSRRAVEETGGTGAEDENRGEKVGRKRVRDRG